MPPRLRGEAADGHSADVEADTRLRRVHEVPIIWGSPAGRLRTAPVTGCVLDGVVRRVGIEF